MSNANQPFLLCIVGPTGVGKTDVGIELAKRLNGEIISADSMQIYRHMDIATAKPPPPPRAEVPHHCIDIVDPDEEYNVARFQADAERAIADIGARGKQPILVGGTGLYVRAVLWGFAFPIAPPDWELREGLWKEETECGAGRLHRRLQAVDPTTAARLHPNDTKRIVRALEVFLRTGRTMSEHLSSQPRSAQARLDESAPMRYNAVAFGLTMEREKLYRRLEARIDVMLAAGFLDELRELLKRGYDEKLTALQGLGYKQMIPCLRGAIEFSEAVTLWKRDTRRFAKRQLTWFRREAGVRWIDVGDVCHAKAVAEHLLTLLAAEH